MMNENAISNILVDVDFLEDQLRSNGRQHLNSHFTELRSVRRPISPLPSSHLLLPFFVPFHIHPPNPLIFHTVTI